MSVRDWFGDGGPWWGPYLGVGVLGLAALVGILLVVALNAGEILRTLRAAGG